MAITTIFMTITAAVIAEICVSRAVIVSRRLSPRSPRCLSLDQSTSGRLKQLERDALAVSRSSLV